nr:amidohydrolase [Bacteroidota bacterium]
MQDLTITFIQSNLVWEDTEANLERFDAKLSQIRNQPDLVILPEMFNTGFSINPDKTAEKPDGRSFEWLKQKAVELNCTITASILTDDGGKYYNRLFWIHPEGTFFTYDKRHLFRLGEEYKVFSAGTSRNIFKLKGWKILPLICYDLRFPVWSKNRYADGNYEYDLLIYIANWPEIRSYAWKQLLIARAIENQSYVAGVNRVGNDGHGIAHSGDSMVVDPNGKVLMKAQPHHEDILSLQISHTAMEDYRSQFRVGLDWDAFRIEV